MKTMEITNARQARTLSPSHMRQCIMSESRFDFLRELVKDIPNISFAEEYAAEANNAPDPSPTYTVAAILPSNCGVTIVRQMSGSAAMDRPRRNYQRPMSFDVADNHHHRHPSSSADPTSNDALATGILKRKLLDPSRKSASTDSAPGRLMPAKLTRLDSAPAAFSERKRDVPLAVRRRRSKDTVGRASLAVDSALPLLPPSVNISTDSMSTPIIKIDYNQPSFPSSAHHVPGSTAEITPVINIDFSNLVSAPGPVNGSGKVLGVLSSEIEAALATPNLTTPTCLNLAPPFPGAAAAAAAIPAATGTVPGFPVLGLASTLEMDEDYDDL